MATGDEGFGLQAGRRGSRVMIGPFPRRISVAAAALALVWSFALAPVPRAVEAVADPVIAAAGDIACDPGSSSFNGGNGTSSSCQQKATAALLAGGLAAILPLGDNQYYCGGLTAFNASYDLSWGAWKSITRPAVGNHEYLTSGGTGCDGTNSGAAGYFAYFGANAGQVGAGWYSYDIGAWHLIALNSNCGDAGGCSASSPQGKWLAADLAAHPTVCTLAYWHIPLFSSGGRASSNSKSFWDQLYAAGADVILAGHDHTYERFARQTPTGVADATRGIREFIVGTGGANHTSFATTATNSEVRNSSTYGVLRLTLHATSYDWQFAPTAGASFTDSGSEACVTNGSVGATPPPSPSPSPVPSSSPSTAPSSSAGPTPAADTAPSQPPTTTNLVTIADSYVNADAPGSNYGTSTALRSDGSPILRTYLRFDPGSIQGTITRATLRFLPNANHSAGIEVHRTSNNTWTETGLTYANAPPYDTAITATSGTLTTGVWASMDVTSALTGGMVSFVLTTTSVTQTNIWSRQSVNSPYLVVETTP